MRVSDAPSKKSHQNRQNQYMRVSEGTPLYSANIVTPDREGHQGGTGFSGKPDESLALVPRRPDAPSAESRNARRVWGTRRK